jgi:hypothetical protein
LCALRSIPQATSTWTVANDKVSAVAFVYGDPAAIDAIFTW